MDRLYWLPLLKNLRSYMRAAAERDDPAKLLFDGVDIHMGKSGSAAFPYIDLIWAAESGIPKINQGKRIVELWIDCWSKYTGGEAEPVDELYRMQCKVSAVLSSWPEYLRSYTFPGGAHIAVTAEIKKLSADGSVIAPIAASRFLVELAVKEEFHAGAEMFPLMK